MMELFVKNTHDIHFERKEVIILFLSMIFLAYGLTSILGIFGIMYMFFRIVHRILTTQNYEKSLNANFVN
jgi:hypothetical protein